MEPITIPPDVREQLLDRRQRLEVEVARAGVSDNLGRLLQEVDLALARLQDGTYGICETCHDAIEADRLLADPLVRFCLDHLTASEQRALEHDLELAGRMQRALLPAAHTHVNGLELAYHYAPAGVVSGDYCDYLVNDAGDLYFMIGDVSGKGVAASMYMAHLHATLRTLILMGLPLDQLMARASRLFCESALPAHYATLVCGHVTRGGEVALCNAGHPPPLVLRGTGIQRLDATGLPIGMFPSSEFSVARLPLAPGEAILLYTDGVIEAENGTGAEYGADRLSMLAARSVAAAPLDLIGACLKDLSGYTAGFRPADDVTVMAIRRT